MIEDFSEINGEGTILRKAQRRVLDILIEVDKICRKHDLQYWLIGGTLLGAVRHKGFIPWDDDIDISIEQKDLKKLRKILQEELPKQFVIQDYKSDKNYYIDSIFRVRDRKSYFPLETHKSFKEQGLVLDIIPMQRIPSIKFKRLVFNCNKQPYLRRKELSLTGKSNNIKGLLLTPLAKLLISLAHWYSNNTNSNKFGYNYLFYLGPCFEMRLNKNIIFPLKTIKFEGIDFYTVNKIDEYLTLAYGDYMKIPTAENRQTHATHIEVFD